MVSATTYHDWRFLLRLIQRDAAAVDVLEFLDFVEVNGFGPLDAIYPKIRCQLDPPPEYLATGAEVRRWRGLSDSEQAHEVERLAKKRKKRPASESRSREADWVKLVSQDAPGRQRPTKEKAPGPVSLQDLIVVSNKRMVIWI